MNPAAHFPYRTRRSRRTRPQGSGGAIANDGGIATLTNATIAGNTSPAGAGIENRGTLTLINVTVAYNTATRSGGGAGLDAASGTAIALQLDLRPEH